MKIVSYLVGFIILAALGLLLAGQLGLLKGSPPSDLGVTDGRLKPPSKTPNSVSSQAALYPGHPQLDYARIEPLKFSGDGTAAMARLADLLQNTEHTIVITRGLDYVYAQSSTAWLGFTDDVEFWLDKPNGVIQVRSSSRLGRKDFNVNRARIEAIRARFN
jgi:uncharacterized protein (DUF1499 family)